MHVFSYLRKVIDSYHVLPKRSWLAYQACCRSKTIDKGEVLCPVGVIPSHFAFIHKGLMRAYVIDQKGNEFNKNFFCEGRFPGCMTSLLQQAPSLLEVQALEKCELVEIDFAAFRQLLKTDVDVMQFHIAYLEKHWLLEKEQKELNYLQFEAKDRYLDFVELYSEVLPRLTQYHVASFLGITPTQLSRIKKELKFPDSQHM